MRLSARQVGRSAMQTRLEGSDHRKVHGIFADSIIELGHNRRLGGMDTLRTVFCMKNTLLRRRLASLLALYPRHHVYHPRRSSTVAHQAAVSTGGGNAVGTSIHNVAVGQSPT